MRIDKAVLIAVLENKYIQQESCNHIKIKPEKGIPATIMMADGSNPKSGWQPTAEELIADDWVVVD